MLKDYRLGVEKTLAWPAQPVRCEVMIETARELCPPEDVIELTAKGIPRRFAGGAPRYFVPTKNCRVRLGGSKVYPAFRRRARIYRSALRAWISLGGARFTHRVDPGRKDGWPLGELLASDMPTLSTAAVSIGIPGPAQKITVQLMDEDGRILGFAKYADKPYTRTLIFNEARMLEALPENIGPRLTRFTPFMEGDLLVQTPLPGRPLAPRPRLDPSQVRFFERLARPGEAYPASAHPFIKSLHERAGERKGALERVLEDLGDGLWPAAWMHGDMAPWNMHCQSGDCLAYDWEHGTEAGFAHLDAAAALIQVTSIIRRDGPREAKRIVAEGLKPCLPAGGEKFAPALASLSALSMLISWYPPREPDAYEVWLEEFIESPA